MTEAQAAELLALAAEQTVYLETITWTTTIAGAAAWVLVGQMTWHLVRVALNSGDGL